MEEDLKLLLYYVPITFAWIWGLIICKGRISLSFNWTETQKKAYLIPVAAVAIILLGLRNTSVGADTANYANFFTFCKNGGIPSQYPIQSFEIGYQILTKVTSYILPTYGYFFLLIAFVTISLYFKFIYDNSEQLIVSSIVFLGMTYLPSYNLMRQWLGMALCMNALTLLKRKRYFWGTLIILLAFSIHTMMIFAVLIYPVILCKNCRKAIRLYLSGEALVIIGSSAFFRLISIFVPRYAKYVSSSSFASEGSVSSWMKVLIYFSISMLLYNKFVVEKNRDDLVYAIALSIAVCFSIMGNQFQMFHRVAFLYSGVICAAMPRALKILYPRGRMLTIGLMIIAMYGMSALTLQGGNHFTMYATWIV